MKIKDCNGIFGVPHCDWCEEYVECFHKSFNKSQTVTMTGEIKVDENARREIENMFKDRGFVIVAKADDGSLINVASVIRCKDCPVELFDKTMKQILKK